MRITRGSLVPVLVGFLVIPVWFHAADALGQSAHRIDFRRDIQPILADTCFKCHGPDETNRQADLRLDTRDGLFADSNAVVPGELESSELYRRIMSDDADLQMPPSDSGRTLTAEQKSKIELWIQQGATWENHWALVAPVKPEIPTVRNPAWTANPIDHFIVADLEADGLGPSPEADRITLIRRLSLDLTGLPPHPEQVARYRSATDGNWYEQLVDELLASPSYGEHMARYWLDAARYGDTHGLHLDNYREMWAYRDWVVQALNDNLSYRDFAIQQLAGDLLDNPTDANLIASGFNRAHVTTNEGGSIVEEVYVRNVVDRVATTGTVFMGMTIGCAQCHDHKFDPISQTEFYQLFAFFNNMTDPAMDDNSQAPVPVLQVMDANLRRRKQELEAQQQAAAAALEAAIEEFTYVDPADGETTSPGEEPDAAVPQEFVWVAGNQSPRGADRKDLWQAASGEGVPVKSGSESRKQASPALVQHYFTGSTIPLVARAGDTLFADVYLDPDDPPAEVMLQFNDGNWEHRAYWGDNRIDWGSEGSPSRFRAGDLPETGKWVRLEIAAETLGFKNPSQINGMAFTQFGGTAYWDTAGIVSTTPQNASFASLKKWLVFAGQSPADSLPKEIRDVLSQPESDRSADQRRQLRRYFLLSVNSHSAAALEPAIGVRDAAQKQLDDFVASIPTTLISRERDTIKEAFVLRRGEYDQPGETVHRDVPAVLPPWNDELPRNRLGFALWLTSEQHPLTARVAVNRYWQQLFGVGIVKTSEDFGTQGDVPSHPQLLDWLAVDFMEHGWDIKRLMKQLVMSSTYRQSSATTADWTAIDPRNRRLAHGPRFRLDAEVLRDQALAVSGMLVDQLGGPSVKPPQPDGLWLAVGYTSSNTARFKADQGPDKVHRRSLYTFWKRTSPPPQMNTFDAPSREECCVRRERTNTPLQALVLMNEPQFVAAARHLAQRTLDQKLDSDEARVQWMFRQLLIREPVDAERAVLASDLQQHRIEFAAAVKHAQQLVAIGDQPANLEQYDAVELASLTMVASLLMNADEFVTKN